MSNLLGTFKLAICGDSGCGKTSLLAASNSEGGKLGSEAYIEPTIEDSFYKTLQVGKQALTLEILDSSGLSGYRHFRSRLYKGVDAFILCFSICDRASFGSITTWIEEIISISSSSSFIIVGCKSDVRQSYGEDEAYLVTLQEATSLTSKLTGVKYLECSARTGEGIQSVIQWASELSQRASPVSIYKKVDQQTSPEEEKVVEPALSERASVESNVEISSQFGREILLLNLPLTMHLSENIGSRRDSHLKMLLQYMGSHNLPTCSSFWLKIRRTLVICPFRLYCSVQILCHMRSLNIAYSSFFRRSPEELLEKIVEGNSSTNLLLSLTRYLNTRDALKNIITTLRTATTNACSLQSVPFGWKDFAKPQLWLDVLGQTETYDLLDFESTFLLLLDQQPVNKLIEAINTDLSLSDRTDLIDILHEMLQLENGRQERQLQHRRRIDRFLSKIVKETGQLPTSMIVDNVKRKGSNPFSGGGFADVWRGMQGDVEVVMKVLRIYGEREHEKQILWAFCAEALVWHRLHHRNVMPFHGVCIWEFAPQRALISPWMKNGHILDYLREHSSNDRCAMMLGVARGMEYLHTLNPAVVHGDLRASNVLIDDEGQPRISDFGLATFIDSQASTLDQSSFKGKGSMRWQAPELLDSARFNGITLGLTTKSDVYAFACVCLEIFTEQVPFSNLRDGEVILEVAVRDGRPPRPPQPAETRGLSDKIWTIIQDCWAVQPGDRPNMKVVLAQIQGIREVSYSQLWESDHESEIWEEQSQLWEDPDSQEIREVIDSQEIREDSDSLDKLEVALPESKIPKLRDSDSYYSDSYSDSYYSDSYSNSYSDPDIDSGYES